MKNWNRPRVETNSLKCRKVSFYKHLLNYQWICHSDEWNDDTNLWGLFSLRFCGNDGTCMYRRPRGGHWLQVWDTKHCTFRMSFPYIHIPASTYTYRTYSYLCLYTYTHTWNHSVKSHGAEFEWSHTKMSESLKPGLQQPHECLLRTALVQTLLPAAPRVLFVLFSARLLFFSSSSSLRCMSAWVWVHS